MNKRRLLKLADLLEADAKRKNGIRFDMATFGDVGDISKPVSCGTIACAMGLAALSGKFKRAGLGCDVSEGGVRFKWKGRSVDGFRAARRLFAISPDGASHLFGSQATYVDQGRGARAEKAIAKKIRDFVAGKVTTPGD